MPSSPTSLEGRVAIVTGAASGIGRATVSALAEAGASVLAADLNGEGADAVSAELNERGFDARGFGADVGDEASIQAMNDAAVSSIGGLDILHNNAADTDPALMSRDLEIVGLDAEVWDRTLRVNLRGPMLGCKYAIPHMIERGGGSIINMGSNSWWEAGGGFPAYTTAKAAVHGLTRTMARDLGDYRIRVNTVVPGWIMTERQKDLWATPEALEAHRERQCLPDLIEPVYVARMVLFLASDDAAMCSANNYMVEAGSI